MDTVSAMRVARAIVTVTMLGLGACGGQPRAAGAPATRMRSDIITTEEIQRGHWSTAFDLVEALRPRWINNRGPDTIMGTPTEVQVYLNDSRLGGPQTLRGVNVTGITSIQFIDGVNAAGRWGAEHSNGAILISTRGS
jgi:hypothetical protein